MWNLKSYTIGRLHFPKIVTGSGTFCKPVKGYPEDLEAARSANADITIKEVKNFFAENQGFLRKVNPRRVSGR